MKNILFLASGSASRKMLLQEARIPFQVIEQQADELACEWGMPLQQLVQKLAVLKMEHALVPIGKEGAVCFVLTADTLSLDSAGIIHGKPLDRADAFAKIKALRKGGSCGTGFCLDKKIFKNGKWQTQRRSIGFAKADHIFDVPDYCIERYIDSGQSLGASGGIRIEGEGAQFLKMIDGSYTAVVGLPMYEVRQALYELGFFG
ncbi:MAG: Maf family protein [Candidatus Babeliales bacterium]